MQELSQQLIHTMGACYFRVWEGTVTCSCVCWRSVV